MKATKRANAVGKLLAMLAARSGIISIVLSIIVVLGGIGGGVMYKKQAALAIELKLAKADKIQTQQSLDFANMKLAEKAKESIKLDKLYVRAEERKQAWVAEALLWKTKYLEMQNDPDYIVWANSLYFGPD